MSDYVTLRVSPENILELLEALYRAAEANDSAGATTPHARARLAEAHRAIIIAWLQEQGPRSASIERLAQAGFRCEACGHTAIGRGGVRATPRGVLCEGCLGTSAPEIAAPGAL